MSYKVLAGCYPMNSDALISLLPAQIYTVYAIAVA
jgi:hypothetical protein